MSWLPNALTEKKCSEGQACSIGVLYQGLCNSSSFKNNATNDGKSLKKTTLDSYFYMF